MLQEQENWHTGFIIYKEDFAKSAQRLLILTLDRGLIHVMAYGNNSQRNTIGSKLEYFALLSFKVGGKNNNTLREVEVESIPLHLKGTNYYSACYLNELVMYLVKQEALAPQEALELFFLYKDTLLTLASDTTTNNTLINLALRKFELRLLHLVGIIYSLELDYQLQPILPHLTYYFSPNHGFISHHELSNHAQNIDVELANTDPLYQQYLEYQTYQQQDLSLNSFQGSDLLQMQQLFMQDVAQHYGIEFACETTIDFSPLNNLESQIHNLEQRLLPSDQSKLVTSNLLSSSNEQQDKVLSNQGVISLSIDNLMHLGFHHKSLQLTTINEVIDSPLVNHSSQQLPYTPVNLNNTQSNSPQTSDEQFVVSQWQNTVSYNNELNYHLLTDLTNRENPSLNSTTTMQNLVHRTSSEFAQMELAFDEPQLIQGHAVVKLNGLPYTPTAQEMGTAKKTLSSNEFFVYQFECKKYLLQKQLRANQQLITSNSLNDSHHTTPSHKQEEVKQEPVRSQSLKNSSKLKDNYPNNHNYNHTKVDFNLTALQIQTQHPAASIEQLLNLYQNLSQEELNQQLSSSSYLVISQAQQSFHSLISPTKNSLSPILADELNIHNSQPTENIFSSELNLTQEYNPQELAEHLLTTTLKLSVAEIEQLQQAKLVQLAQEDGQLQPKINDLNINEKLTIQIDTLPENEAYHFVYEFTNLEKFRKLSNQIEFLKQVRRLTQEPVKDKIFHSRKSLQEYLLLTNSINKLENK